MSLVKKSVVVLGKPAHDQGGQSFAIDVLSNDDERSFVLVGSFKSRDDGLDRADFLLAEQDESVVIFHFGP